MLEEAGFTSAAIDTDNLFKLEPSRILDAAEAHPEMCATDD